ncbi:MAG: YncE family protein [Kofleriaceae bacterium]
MKMKSGISLALATVLFAGACGDNNDGAPDAPPGNDSMMGMDMSMPARERAVVVAGDFVAAGLLSSLDVEARTSENNVAPATAVGNDPVLRRFGNELFVVNRIENNITILNATTFALVEQISTGTNSNPQDVAIEGNKLFVPVYGGSGIVELTRGMTTITPIDLSEDDPDDKPNCASIYKIGTSLFVTCQILDDSMRFLPPRGPGKLYTVDIGTRTKTGEATLTTANPFGLLDQLPNNGDLVVGTIDFADGSGCLERITTGATPAASCMATNTALGGNVTRVTIRNDTEILAVVANPSFAMGSSLKVIEDNGTVGATFTKAGQVLRDGVACPSGAVVVEEGPSGVAPAPQGLRVYSASQTETTTGPIDVGLKPQSFRALACY